jgi:hypothetical protein
MDLQGVERERRASVAMDAIVTQRDQHDREHRRPKALTAREALEAVAFELLLCWTVLSNWRYGVALSDADWERFDVALKRIDFVAQEALR